LKQVTVELVCCNVRSIVGEDRFGGSMPEEEVSAYKIVDVYGSRTMGDRLRLDPAGEVVHCNDTELLLRPRGGEGTQYVDVDTIEWG
jgi:hypothetical protein